MPQARDTVHIDRMLQTHSVPLCGETMQGDFNASRGVSWNAAAIRYFALDATAMHALQVCLPSTDHTTHTQYIHAHGHTHTHTTNRRVLKRDRKCVADSQRLQGRGSGIHNFTGEGTAGKVEA